MVVVTTYITNNIQAVDANSVANLILANPQAVAIAASYGQKGFQNSRGRV